MRRSKAWLWVPPPPSCVAMGPPPLMCSIEEKLEEKSELPSSYKRYVDDTLATMPDLNEASMFLDKLNSCRRNLKFTMEIAEQNTILFVGMNITKRGNSLKTSVYRKSTNTGLLLPYHNHVDKSYKDCLLTYCYDPSCMSAVTYFPRPRLPS